MPRVAAGDVSLNVCEAGNGPPLVLLHGFTGSAAQWAPHTAEFGRRFRTIAIDLLGHGQSDCPGDPARYRMERCLVDLAAVLDCLRVEKTAWLGYSMGGRVALAFALAYPERVRALVLEGASPGIADPGERRERVFGDEAIADRIERGRMEDFADAWMSQPLFASQARLGPAALAAARAERAANNPVGLANCLRGLGTGAQEPLWDRLPEVAIPILLVVGEEDAKFRSIAAAVADRVSHAKVVLIPEAGHTTHLENPPAFRKCVMEFLGRTMFGNEPPATRAQSPGSTGRRI